MLDKEGLLYRVLKARYREVGGRLVEGWRDSSIWWQMVSGIRGGVGLGFGSWFEWFSFARLVRDESLFFIYYILFWLVKKKVYAIRLLIQPKLKIKITKSQYDKKDNRFNLSFPIVARNKRFKYDRIILSYPIHCNVHQTTPKFF